jgi:transcriptional regulator with XRE-family HTH domain
MRDNVPTLAELLNHLFEVRRHPSGRQYSIREVAAAARGVGRETIHSIRNGSNQNPTRATLLALCLFFEAPASYFFPELRDQRIDPLDDESASD